MAVAARYWRIGVRDNNNVSSGHISFATLKLFNAAGTHITPDATVTATTLVSAGTLPNLIDSLTTTQCGMLWASGGTAVLKYFTYTFASDVLVDRFLVNISPTSLDTTTRLDANRIDFYVQSSTDNITWVTQASWARPLASNDTDYVLAANVDSTYYLFPSTSQIGGTGGIYGIVSEDGVALPNRPVVLYDRESMQRIGYTTTDANGGYSFNGLNENREFMVLSTDPSGPPYKNALVWDRIQPINTKSAITAQSPFWARRLRDPFFGGAVAFNNMLDGTTYNYFEAPPGCYGYDYTNNTFDGATFGATDGATGSFKFLKSNRTPANAGYGFNALLSGCFGQNASGQSANYSNLTFELICIPPTAGESDLLCTWYGTNDSDDGVHAFYSGSYSSWVTGIGPTIQVTTSTIYVRFPLGGANLNTIRAQASCIQGQVNHIVVTYTIDTEIKLYLNGTLMQTTAIAGSGRIFTASMRWDFDQTTNWNNQQNTSYPFLWVAARRITNCLLWGPGTCATNDASAQIRRGWGGYFGMAALYGKTVSASDVSVLYDSLINTASHTVLPTQSGYAAEVENDNPTLYARLNNTSAPTGTIPPLIGRKDLALTFRAGNTYNATGFVTGQPAIDVSNSGGVYTYGASCNTTFTVEMFIRPTSLATAGKLFTQFVYNSITPAYLVIGTNGLLTLNITDSSSTVTAIPFSHTALVVGTNYHIAVTYDPWTEKKASLFINGVLASQIVASTLGGTITADWIGIGCNPTGTITFGTDHFRGVIGEFALYNHRVGDARILAHYNARNN